MNFLFRVCCALFALLLCSAATAQFQTPALAKDKLVLKVAPYPDIPGDYDRMLNIVESGFEAQNPDIDLQFTTMTIHAAYDINTLVEFMTNSTLQGGVHVMEVDTTMLGDLPNRNVVEEQTYTQVDWNPNLVQATMYEGKRYGVPHWACGNFVISKFPSITSAQSVSELRNALKAIKPQGASLGGNWAGDSYMVLYYALAYAENNPSIMDLNPLMTAPVDTTSAFSIKVASDLCNDGTSNPCIDGTYYNDPSQYVEAAANGEYPATFGFSESMWYLMQYGANADDWYISPLPVGKHSRYLGVADAYVVRKNLSPEITDAITRFYDFMMQDSTYFDIILSGGAIGEQVPRYLIPARTILLTNPTLAKYPYYRRILAAISTPNSTAYQNLFVPENRERIYAAVMKVLERSPHKRKRVNWRKHFSEKLTKLRNKK